MTKRIRHSAKDRYEQHRRNARKYNVPFLLSFEEWYDIWISSGHWNQRGQRSDQYCMARYWDQGAYEVSNVRIITNHENGVERNEHDSMGDWYKQLSPEERARYSATMREATKGISKPDHWRIARSAASIGRKMVTRNGKRTWAHPGEPDYPEV